MSTRQPNGLPVCYAPFKGLRLNPGGRVNVCCHNQTDVIGRFPQQSLAEIWKGPKIHQLQETLSSGHFAAGCTHCAREAQGSPARGSRGLYDRFHASGEQPVMLDFKTDIQCNYACVMCSGLSSSSFHAQVKTANNPWHTEALLWEIRNWLPGLAEIRFSGGEPMLSDFYRRIWEMAGAINPQCRLVVQTNGSILDEGLKKLISNGNFHINLSIDSFREESYRKIRRGGDLGKVLENAAFFRDTCLSRRHFFGMTACAMQSNHLEFEDIVSHWNRFQAHGWFSVVWFPPAEALWGLSAETLDSLEDRLAGLSLPDGNETEQANAAAVGVLHGQLSSMRELSSLFYSPPADAWVSLEDALHEQLDPELVNAIVGAFGADKALYINHPLFSRILALSSPALLAELIETIDRQGIRSVFSPFIQTKNRPS